jgi:hypothetical protein
MLGHICLHGIGIPVWLVQQVLQAVGRLSPRHFR